MFTSTSTTTPNEYSILELPPNPIRPPLVMERAMATTTKWRYYNNNGNNAEVAPNCPRCASSDTKFCYYNNYSLSQPRYFCKGCRRYWTKGGSLRNVPVGGGCRKSRRARGTRQGGGSSYPGPALGQSSVGPETEKATDIDLAAVFAKYVNQDDVVNEESSSPGAASFTSSDILQASSLDTDSQAEDITMFEYQEPLDLVNGGGDPDQLQQAVMPNNQLTMHDDINCQDFMYQDSSSAFELHDILGDQLEADILWPEGSNLPNFEPQHATVQLQDFGLFSADDDPLRVPANLVNDHWGSFDLSAYEIFSRP